MYHLTSDSFIVLLLFRGQCSGLQDDWKGRVANVFRAKFTLPTILKQAFWTSGLHERSFNSDLSLSLVTMFIAETRLHRVFSITR